MIFPCSSEELGIGPCQYNCKVDTEKDAYSMRKMCGKAYYYHYLDFARSEPENIITTPGIKRKVAKELIAIWESGRKEKWLANFLSSLGYHVE